MMAPLAHSSNLSRILHEGVEQLLYTFPTPFFALKRANFALNLLNPFKPSFAPFRHNRAQLEPNAYFRSSSFAVQ